MKEPFHLGPGSGMPAWMEELDRACFGETWGSLAGHEEAWAKGHDAFALWSLNAAASQAELLRVAVAPGLRRTGRGRELMAGCEAALCSLGIQTLLLEVRESNMAARALYESQGWRQDGLRKAYYKDGEDAALYRKELG